MYQQIFKLMILPLVLACFALSRTAQAQLPSPTPDGGYPNENTAEGSNALLRVTTGKNDTAIGGAALTNDTSGSNNTSIGANTLFDNVNGNNNTSNGANALLSNKSGSNNTATGALALSNNTTITGISGNSNTANGFQALQFNTTGSFNTADGANALRGNTGSSNTALGTNAGSSLTTGSGNVCIGANVVGVNGESNTTRIRNIFSSVASAKAVFVNSDNKIGTLPSSARFKEEIKPMNKASEVILALKPVTFRYKPEVDPAHAPMFGLIAEEVEKVDPDLVTRNDKGEAETVRYEAVNAMLLNEFLKEHQKVQEQEATIAQLKQEFQSKLAQQQKQIEAFSAALQKVTDQLELSKSEPQTVANNQ